MSPTSPLRPCATPRCPALVTRGHCPVHARPAWSRTQPVPRIRGRKLQAIRQRLFQAHPLCVLCSADGRVTLATIRDHVIPLAEGGRDDATNEQAICQTCSDAKTAQESKRGRARVR
jgi:5-methylcytosine-specific restriction protein A